MTEPEFWRAVGGLLSERRMRQRLTAAAVEANGGPTNKTVEDIEAGRVGRVSSLRELAHAVNIDLVDLFRAALQLDADDGGPDLQFVIRQFKDGGVRVRAALMQTALLAEEQRREPPSPESPVDREVTLKEKPIEERAAAKRRGKK